MLLIKPYNRGRAVEYAKRWAMERNPLFIDFTGNGGDCTSFVSQSLLAGSCVMDFTPTFGWYYISPLDRAPAWSGVEAFYDYITGSDAFPPVITRPGPFGTVVGRAEALEGDIIQFADAEGDFYHTVIITGFAANDILVSAHSDDALDRRLSTYKFASMRIIHIEGVRTEVPDDVCFDDLINGVAITGIENPGFMPSPMA